MMREKKTTSYLFLKAFLKSSAVSLTATMKTEAQLEVLLKRKQTFHEYCLNIHIIPVRDCCIALFFL